MENGTLTDFEQNAKTVIRFLQDNLEKIKELHKDLTRQYTQSIIQRANNIAFEIIQSFNTFDKAYSQILRWYLRNRMPEYERRIKDGWSQIQKKAKKIVFLSQTEHRFSEYSGKAYLEVGKLMWYMEHLRDDLLYCVKDDKKQLVDEQSRERETKEPTETCKIAWESYEWVEWVTKERPDLVHDESKKIKQLVDGQANKNPTQKKKRKKAKSKAGQTPPQSNFNNVPLTAHKIAELEKVPYEPLRKRLERYRGRDMDCYVEISNRKMNEPQFLYYLPKVKPVVDTLKKSIEMSSKRPAEKKSN